ncbi:MAG TPA: hypothetical protein VH143_29340 [Kofleriaceae bacterium]|jgi:hypothetical protein|nr:hypothetical protein [Kofleriaceae bacterium]
MRLVCLVIALAASGSACGGAAEDANEPQTARDKQMQEAKANGELDGSDARGWGGWRYQGDRAECFYVVGRRCFKSKKHACASACRIPLKTAALSMCTIDGGGPASVTCNKK